MMLQTDLSVNALYFINSKCACHLAEIGAAPPLNFPLSNIQMCLLKHELLTQALLTGREADYVSKLQYSSLRETSCVWHVGK